MLKVFIALGKQMPKNKAMIEDTEEVARLLAKYNCTMVQGGAKVGLMGVVVKEFQKYSEEVVMIVPEVYKDDLIGAKYKEHYIVDSESERMKITIRTCDMMIVLPGGSGTLAELSYYNETCKSGEHNAKIILVNTKGYYNQLIKFHKNQIKNGFMGKDGIKYEVINNAKQLEPILQQLITEKQAHIQQEEVKSGKQEVIEEAQEVTEIKPAKTTAKKSTKAKIESKPDVKEEKEIKAKAQPKKVIKVVSSVSPKTSEPAKVEATPVVVAEPKQKEVLKPVKIEPKKEKITKVAPKKEVKVESKKEVKAKTVKASKSTKAVESKKDEKVEPKTTVKKAEPKTSKKS
ncbi:MAG: LOG family protein, partial [Clostridia bacterium]|nr:LOG family protein [Clostridia bacterium]